MILTRRQALVTAAGGLLAGCDTVASSDIGQRALFSAEDGHRILQRAVTDRTALAPEFRDDQRSPFFRPNGTRNPNTPDYNASAATGFADWRVRIDGLVAARSTCRWPICAPCPRERRSPVTTVSRGGARSASGPGRG